MVKIKTYLLIVFFFYNLQHVKGQELQNPPIKYRIVAVNASNHDIKSISNELELYYPLAIRFPDAFTPNNDGLNDTFGAVGEGIEKFRLVIFNRWGNMIFESDHIEKRWDGTYKGEQVPPGAYNYEVYAQGKEYGKLHKAGTVVVTK